MPPSKPAIQCHPGGVYRLSDMLVEEVSLVDRAANKRKFLIIKRDAGGEMATGAEVQKNELGELTTAAQAPTQEPAPTEAKVQVEKAALSLTSDAQTEMRSVLVAVRDRLDTAIRQVEGAVVVATEAEMEATSLVELCISAQEDLEDATMALLGENVDSEGEGVEKRWVPETLAKRLELQRARRVISKAEVERSQATLMQKFGARMAKERLQRFHHAVRMLGDLVSEMTPEQAASMSFAKKCGKCGGTTGVCKCGGTGSKKKVPMTLSKADEAPPPVDIQPTIAKLASSLQALFEVVSQQERVLKSMTDVRPPSNALQIDNIAKSSPVQESAYWPMDMNRPMDRKTVGETYFADDE